MACNVARRRAGSKPRTPQRLVAHAVAKARGRGAETGNRAPAPAACGAGGSERTFRGEEPRYCATTPLPLYRFAAVPSTLRE